MNVGKVNNKIILWGKDGYNPLGLLRQLHDIGHVILLLSGGSLFCAVKSQYCKHLHKSNSLEDGLQWLIENFSNEDQKPFIITTGDIVAEFVDHHREELQPFFYLMGTIESGLLSKVIDKNYMNILAMRHGFLVPKSMVCQWDTDISNVAFPCILKPDKNRRNHAKEFKTRLCDSKAELISVLESVAKESKFILQEYIPKQYDALVYGCRTMSGNVIVPGIIMKDRWDEGGDGCHGYLTPDIPKSINIDSIQSFLEEIGYYGLFSVEYGIVDDKAYFYEFNLRNDGTSHYFCQAGCNVPLLWIWDTIGRDYSHLPIKLDGYHEFMSIVDDFQNIFADKVSLRKWKKDLHRATVFRIFDRHDMRPFYYHILAVLFVQTKVFIKKILKR